MRDNGLAMEWQWQLLIDGDTLSVTHRCRDKSDDQPIELDQSSGMLRCRRCGDALSIRRSPEWPA